MSAKYVIKLLTLGDSLVGKTSIVMRYSDNKFTDTFATIGIDFKTKFFTIKNQVVKVIIWDTAGQEKFRNIVNQYYKGADGVLLTYDITSRKSFENIDYWLNELKKNNDLNEISVYLVGNKSDLEGKRAVSFEEGKNYADKNKINFSEVSAKTGKGIINVFNKLMEGCVAKINSQFDIEEQIELGSISNLNNLSNKNKSRCCG